METLNILTIMFATSSGLVCVYALISSFLLFLSSTKLSKGEDFSKLVNTLFITVLIGFIYSLWNLLSQLGFIKVSTISGFMANILVIIFFVMLAYLAFLTKQIATKFGFRRVGEEINHYLKTAKVQKKAVKKRRK